MVTIRKKSIITIMPVLITLLVLMMMPKHPLTAYASDTKMSLSTTSITIGTNYNPYAVIKGSIYGDISSQYYVYAIDEKNLVTIQSGYIMSNTSFSLNITSKKVGTTKVKVAIKDQKANQVVATGYVNVTVKNYDISKISFDKNFNILTAEVGGAYNTLERLYHDNGGVPFPIYWSGGVNNAVMCEFSNFKKYSTYTDADCRFVFLQPGTYYVDYGIRDKATNKWIRTTNREFRVKSVLKDKSFLTTVGSTFKLAPSVSTVLKNKVVFTSVDSPGLSHQGNNSFKAEKAGTYKIVYTLNLYYNNKWYPSEKCTYTVIVQEPRTTTATKTTTKTTTTTAKTTTKTTTTTIKTTTKTTTTTKKSTTTTKATTTTTAKPTTTTVTTTKTTARSTFTSSASSVSTSITTTAPDYTGARYEMFIVLVPDEEISFREFEGKGYEFWSMDSDVADVDEDGKITAYEEGETIVFVYDDEDVVSMINVFVTDVLDPDNISIMNEGEREQIIEYDGMDYEFDTSDPTVAVVSEDGVITAVGEGEAYISIYAENEEEYLEDRIMIIVKDTQDSQYITLNPEDEILIDEYAEYDPEFTSDNPAVATVSEDGLITAVHSGEAIVTVICNNGRKFYIYVSVNSVYHEDFRVSLEVGETAQIGEYLGWNPVYESTDTAVATVSDDGVITAVGTGEAVIVVSDKEEEWENHIYVTVYPSAVSTTGVVSETSTTTTTTTSQPVTSTTTAATTTTAKPTTTATTTATTTTAKPTTTTTTAATTTTKPATSSTTTTTATTTSSTTTAVTTTTTTETQPTKKSGDINGDGAINLKDVVLLRRYIAGGWGVELDETVADVNKDGAVNLKDVVLLRRYIAGGWGVAL